MGGARGPLRCRAQWGEQGPLKVQGAVEGQKEAADRARGRERGSK